jgi:DNA-binding CsgD family transcriptional regulator/tetratricopeptide (TPR) repeat protein
MATPARLRGRDEEIAILHAALDQAASSRSALVVVEGEPGVGKSRLLAAACDEARRRRWQVAVGQAEELEQSRPFGLMAGALSCTASAADARRKQIAALLMTQGSADGGPISVSSDPGLRFRVVDAIADLTEELVLSGPPLLIGLDDLQWVDPSSLLTLGTLIRRVTDLPIVLLVCLRPFPRSAELGRMLDALFAAGALHVNLRGLDSAAVTDLITDSSGAEPGPRLLAAVARAAGNPLFITELLSALAHDRAIGVVDGRSEVTNAALSPSLRLTILRRLSFVPEPTLAALRAAAILGSSFTLGDLSVTTARPAFDLSLALTDALGARVLEEHDDRLRFRHDLIRDAIYEDVPVTVRRALHREAGHRLANADASVQQVAEQFRRGATQGDAEAVGWLTRAARAAAARSPAIAADLLGRAAELSAPADTKRDQLWCEQASCLMWAGQVEEAERICRSLLNGSHDQRIEGAARLCLGLALLVRGRAQEAIAQLERAAQSPASGDAERATALAWASVARTWLGDLDEAATVAEKARFAATASGNHHAVTVALATSAVVSSLRGRLREALQISDEAVRLADRSPGKEGHRYPIHAVRGFVLIELDRLDDAGTTIDDGMRIREELGVSWQSVTYQTVRVFQRYVAGSWDDALAEIEASGAIADESGDPYTRRLMLSVLSLIRLHRNDVTGAIEAADTAVRLQPEGSARYRTQWAPWARALALEAGGQITAAFHELARVWDDCARLGRDLEYPMFGPDLVRLALAAGDRTRADEVCDALANVADMNDVPSLTGAALRCRGLADDDPEKLGIAAHYYTAGPRVLDAALTNEETGVAYLRHGQAQRGRPFLDDAAQIYEGLDASRDIARIEATLRAAGVRRGRKGSRRRPERGWASLTPTEQTVARLVAEGLSNPQIGRRLYVSHRTVQTHLAHIFTKLQIASRVQLTAEVTRRHRLDPAALPHR